MESLTGASAAILDEKEKKEWVHHYMPRFKKSPGEGEIKQNLKLNFQGTAKHQGQ